MVKPDNSAPLTIRAQQLELLFSQSYHGAYISLLVAMLLTALLWPVQNHTVLLTWLAGILITGALRLSIFIRFRHKPLNPAAVPAWERAYFLGVVVYFLSWGLGCVWIIPSDSQVHQVLVMYFLIGMSGSAVSVFSAHRVILITAVSALLVPILPWFYARGDLLSIGVALAATAFYLSSIRSSRVLSNTMKNNLELTQQLRDATASAERLARVDELTGVNNRRAFYELGESELARSNRTGSALSAIALDADYFKRINDQHGHSTGDLALQHLARLLTEGLRGTDICGRTGGEEFAILLPDTNLASAVEVAQKLRQTLQQTPLETDNITLIVTASFGVAQAKDSLQALLHEADTALYRAKDSGRNQVALAPTAAGSNTPTLLRSAGT